VGCPAGTQLVNGICLNKLQSCSGGRIFNVTSQICECSAGTFYDVSI
jgi:hypothetical protein